MRAPIIYLVKPKTRRQELNISKSEIDVMKKMKWYSFDQYKAKAFNICNVTLPMDEAKLLDDQCYCLAFFKSLCANMSLDWQ